MPHGFTGHVIRVERAWPSHPRYELDSIRNRAWSGLRRLDADDCERIAGPQSPHWKRCPKMRRSSAPGRSSLT